MTDKTILYGYTSLDYLTLHGFELLSLQNAIRKPRSMRAVQEIRKQESKGSGNEKVASNSNRKESRWRDVPLHVLQPSFREERNNGGPPEDKGSTSRTEIRHSERSPELQDLQSERQPSLCSICKKSKAKKFGKCFKCFIEQYDKQ